MKLPEEPGKVSYILIVALVIVVLVSFLPLGRLSGGKLHDFSVFDDIVTERYRLADEQVEADAAPVDSALTAMQRELEAEEASSVSTQTVAVKHGTDSIAVVEGSVADSMSRPIPPPVDPRRDGYVAIEDYSGNEFLSKLRSAFAASRQRNVMIAFVGDSYIEGDIFTQDVRALLQDTYGGSGVGYVNMYSEFPGFRRSVRQSGSGWNVKVAGHKGYRRGYAWLSEQYSIPEAEATANASYAGTGKVSHAASWSHSTFAFWAPEGAKVRMRANKGEWQTFTVDPSDGLQTVAIDSASIKSFEVSVPAGNSITALGVWLDASTGVSVDCMSSRGFSGVTLRDVSSDLCHSLSHAGIGYDLIVLEFGINAMSPGQTDYTSYGKLMGKVIDHIRVCYPDAAILLMGIGDRGEKHGANVRSMPGAVAMVNAQRDVARRAGCLFWDTREAMGGDGAIVSWANANPPRANKDYIHLNHHGGSVLAQEFVKSLSHALDN